MVILVRVMKNVVSKCDGEIVNCSSSLSIGCLITISHFDSKCIVTFGLRQTNECSFCNNAIQTWLCVCAPHSIHFFKTKLSSIFHWYLQQLNVHHRKQLHQLEYSRDDQYNNIFSGEAKRKINAGEKWFIHRCISLDHVKFQYDWIVCIDCGNYHVTNNYD